jgi:hypothetical protein
MYITNTKAMELTLTKTQTYKLEPYGKFAIKLRTRQGNKPNVIPYEELRVEHETSMPMSKEQEKLVVGLMKKHKTDILTDGSYFGFYTRIGDGLTQVRHKKLILYREDEAFKIAVDNGHSFGKK